MKRWLRLSTSQRFDHRQEPYPFLLSVHPEYTPYIPLHFFTNLLYTYHPNSDEDRFGNIIPKLQYTHFTISTSIASLSEIFTPSNDQSKLFGLGGRLYASSTLVLKEGQLVYGIFVKSKYVLNLFDQYFNFLNNESLAWDYYKKQSFMNDDSVFKYIQGHLSYEYFSQKIGDELLNNIVLFSNTSYNDYLNDNYPTTGNHLDYFKSNNLVVIEDRDGDYFLSEGFVSIELPVFESIDGPEQLLIEEL